MDVIEPLSSKEKEIFLLSLQEINKHIDFFIIRFYHYFLQTKAETFFRDTTFESQNKMFNTILNVLITYIADPTQLKDYLQKLIKIHSNLSINSDHVDYVISSFINSLNEIFNEEADVVIIEIWTKVINEVMIHFKNGLQLEKLEEKRFHSFNRIYLE